MTTSGGGSGRTRSRHRQPLAGPGGWRLIRSVAVLCVLAGLAVLAHVGYTIWDPGAARTEHRLTSQLHQQWRDHRAQAITLRAGRPFAFLRIPKFGPHWRFAVVQGTALAQLALGPGHVPGTQLPGQPGNFAVAAHDITAGNPFLHLRSLGRGDQVIVTTVNAVYRYRVLTNRIVGYTDTSVLDPVPGHPGARPATSYLTLITCTPVTLAFTPWRIVVTGVLVSTRWRR